MGTSGGKKSKSLLFCADQRELGPGRLCCLVPVEGVCHMEGLGAVGEEPGLQRAKAVWGSGQKSGSCPALLALLVGGCRAEQGWGGGHGGGMLLGQCHGEKALCFLGQGGFIAAFSLAGASVCPAEAVSGPSPRAPPSPSPPDSVLWSTASPCPGSYPHQAPLGGTQPGTPAPGLTVCTWDSGTSDSLSQGQSPPRCSPGSLPEDLAFPSKRRAWESRQPHPSAGSRPEGLRVLMGPSSPSVGLASLALHGGE